MVLHFSCPVPFDASLWITLREVSLMLLCLTVNQTSLNETCRVRLDRYSSLHLVTDNLEIFNSSQERDEVMCFSFSSLLPNSLTHYSRGDTLVFSFSFRGRST